MKLSRRLCIEKSNIGNNVLLLQAETSLYCFESLKEKVPSSDHSSWTTNCRFSSFEESAIIFHDYAICGPKKVNYNKPLALKSASYRTYIHNLEQKELNY